MMQKTPVYIVDKLVIGQNHVMFNAAITAIIAGIYSDREVIFIAERKHAHLIEEINQHIPNLRFRTFDEEPLPDSKFSKILPWINKKTGDRAFIRQIYKELEQYPQAKLFFTCLSASALYYAASKSRQQNVQTTFVLHGEVEFMFRKDIRFTDRLKGGLYKGALRYIDQFAHCIVLGDVVKEKLCQRQFISAAKVIAIDHPVLQEPTKVTPLTTDPLLLGHVGMAMQKKNSMAFFELAESFAGDARVKFELVGKAEPELLPVAGSNVRLLSADNKSISRADYHAYIEQLGYAVFTFDNSNYVFRISGALMDAVYFQKPIIALKQDYIDYLFATGGNIGFVCEDMTEMRSLIERLIDKDPALLSQYAEQQQRLGIVKRKFSNDSVMQHLQSQLP